MTLIIFTILIMIMIMIMTITLTNHIHHISNLDMLPLGHFFPKKTTPQQNKQKNKENQQGHIPHLSIVTIRWAISEAVCNRSEGHGNMRFGSTSKLASQWKLCLDQGCRPRVFGGFGWLWSPEKKHKTTEFSYRNPVRLVGWLVGWEHVGWFWLTLGRLVGWEHVGWL